MNLIKTTLNTLNETLTTLTLVYKLTLLTKVLSSSLDINTFVHLIVFLYKQMKWWLKALIEWSVDLLHWMPYCFSIYWRTDKIFIAIYKHWLRQYLLSNCLYVYQIVIDLYEVLTKQASLHMQFHCCFVLGQGYFLVIICYWLFVGLSTVMSHPQD